MTSLDQPVNQSIIQSLRLYRLLCRCWTKSRTWCPDKIWTDKTGNDKTWTYPLYPGAWNFVMKY